MKNIIAENALFEIASAQGGYFSAIQAKNAGFNEKNHSYHVRAGNWIREMRGIYRLARYPIQNDAQYSLWSVWSLNRKGVPQGIYSHETALSLYELSDLQPEKIHMTLPRGYRRHGEIPELLSLHYATVNLNECEIRNGYFLTKPFRIIIDLIRSNSVSPEFIKQAANQALDRGLLLQSQYRELKETKRIGAKLTEIMGEEI